jgi:hypothetical protein
MLYFWLPSQVWFGFLFCFFFWVGLLNLVLGSMAFLLRILELFSANSNLTAAPWVASYQTLLNLYGTQNVGEMFFKRSFDQRPIIRDLKNSIGYCAQSSNFPKY